jgi:ABC-2 type transport system ATP-binding protein
MTGLALSAQGIHKRFVLKATGQTVHALADVSMDIRTGEVSALVGPDGAGKTTLLRLAAGLLDVDAGGLTVLGLDAARDSQEIQNRISYMPQRFGLYEDLSVQENLDLYADMHGVAKAERREIYDRLLAMTSLAPFTSRLVGQLSGGMKQKLGLACTLVRTPELLLLDEPTVGVDPVSRQELWEILGKLTAAGKLTVIVSTSYLDEAERCAQVFVLHEGRLLTQGDPGAIRAHAEGMVSIATPARDEPARVLQARLLDDPDTVDAVPQGGEVRFIRQGPAPAARLAGATVRAAEARLEDGFMVLLRAIRPASAAPAPMAVPPDQKAPDRAETIIEVKDLVRKFGDFTAVNRTSFSVRRGEVFGLLGPNGAGKTTTFRILCGLLPATSGYLRVAGVDLRLAKAEARRKVGYVAQKFSLYGNISVTDNLRFFGGVYGLRGPRLAERMAAVTGQFDLGGHAGRPSGQLPGGFKQRLAMAAALLHEPEILFLDEPTSGADPLARRQFWRRITALAAAGTTVIVTTHFMEEAEYCDRILIQDAGSVLALGTPQEVRARAGAGPEHPMTMDAAFIAIVEQSREGGGAP